ncbi:MAG: hypothetical protein RIF41_13395 [Polyangiaceae bacterium]
MKRLVVVLAAVVVVACGDDAGPVCPDHSGAPSVFVPTGIYAGTDTCGMDCEIDFAPRDGADDFSLEVDREAGLVWIRFMRDGVSVEERWRIVGRQVDQ